MLSVPRVQMPAQETTASPSSTYNYDAEKRNSHMSIETVSDYDDLNSQRPSISDERFYLPVCSPIVSRQPVPIPELAPIPGKFPSDKDVGSEEAKPTKRTHPLTVVQTGVFYFFSCGWCGASEESKQVRKEANATNHSFRERWRYEIENRPKALRKLIKTTADNVETNIVPSLIARMSHHYHTYTGANEPLVSGTGAPAKASMDVKSMNSEDAYGPAYGYSRWRGREFGRPRNGIRDDPPIQNFTEPNSPFRVNNDLMWMMAPPPAAVWKSDVRGGPRLALAEEEEQLDRGRFEPRLVSTVATTPSRPRPTIMRIPTLPSIDTFASMIAEGQQQEAAANEKGKGAMFPRPPSPIAIPYPPMSSHNRTISRPQPFSFNFPGPERQDYSVDIHTSNSITSSSIISPGSFSRPRRTMSWETFTTTPLSHSSSERDLQSRDGTATPATTYSTMFIPRLKAPALTKTALATKDENGNHTNIDDKNEMQYEKRLSAVKVSEFEALFGTEFTQTVLIPLTPPGPVLTPVSATTASPRSHQRRRSIPLTGLRV